MTKTGDEQERQAAAQPAFDPARLPYFSEALSMNPLLGHPAAAMAAATAIGFGFANQMAGAFFGALQSAMEATNRQQAASPAVEAEASAASAVSAAPVETTVAPDAMAAQTVAPFEKPKVKAVRKAVSEKPAVEKKAEAKVVVAEAKPEVNAKQAKAKAGTKAAVKAPVKPKVSKVAADDDLKRISGIGPKLESILKGMGVTSFAQIASWGAKDIARFDKELGFEGRIVRDDWIGQAKALLK